MHCVMRKRLIVLLKVEKTKNSVKVYLNQFTNREKQHKNNIA
jgi:hypothetical protein